ncbi:MAG: MFS transporter [Bacteroidota bacterium]
MQLSNAYLIGTLVSATLLTKVGKLYDVYGGRIIAMLAVLLLGSTLILISFSDDLAGWLAADVLGTSSVAVPFVTITVCFFLLRFSGQGVLTMVSRTMLMKWFIQNRGFANGLSGVAVSFGFSIAPGILNKMIDQSGWEQTLWQLALLAFGFFVFAFGFFRDNPKSSDCEPDGGRPLFQTKSKPQALPDQDASLSEAKRTYVLWIFTLTFMLVGLYVTALTFHIADVFEKVGKSRSEAFNVFIPIAFVALFFHFFGSWLSDYIRLRYLLWLQLLAIVFSTVAVINLGQQPWAWYLLVVCNGTFSGLYGVLTNVSWPRFFGLTHLGAISGFAVSWNVAGSALGPALFSLAEQQTGSYSIGCYVVMAMAVVLFVLALRLRRA